MNLSIIIVNYNTEKLLKECLNSIYRYTEGLEFEVIVVDNNSTNREIELFPEEFPETIFIFLNENRGFGYGNNYGFRQSSSSKYVCMLNPDILLINNALFELFSFLENNKNYAVCSGFLVNSKGEAEYTYNNFPGLMWFFREAIISGTRNVISNLNNIYKNQNKGKKNFDVDWVMGACLFMKSNVFKEVNGFDEKIFLYYEDTDLQLRISILKYKIACLPEIRLVHYTKSSVRNETIEDTYHLNIHKSRVYYINKHFGFFNRILIKTMFIIGILMRICVLPFNKKYSGLRKMKYVQMKTILLLYC